MERHHRPLAAALLCGALAVAGPAPGAHHEGEHEKVDHAAKPHRFVRITDAGLHPKVQRVEGDEAFGWVNYSRNVAQVSFDAEVAKNLTCASRTSFRLSGDRLLSTDIQATQFATLCQLAPGEYRYEVELASGLGTGGTLPGRTLEGRLIVEEP